MILTDIAQTLYQFLVLLTRKLRKHPDWSKKYNLWICLSELRYFADRKYSSVARFDNRNGIRQSVLEAKLAGRANGLFEIVENGR